MAAHSDTPARDRLLTATADLVYAGGIEATGVDAIAAHAGVTKRTLYQHFGSKANLVGAALDAADEPLLAGLRYAVERRAQETGDPPILALFDVLEHLFETEEWRGCAFQNATLEVADRSHPVHEVARRHIAKRRALVEELLGDADPATVYAGQLIVEGAMVLSATRQDPAVASRARAAVARIR
jgi:AcrR family transcriptional regulator